MKDDFSYDAQKLISYFKEHPVETLVIINPDNPTGHWMSRGEIEKLLCWCKEQKINLVLDESFADFAEDENVSMISEDVFCENPNLYVVKSISKSYGVPGLRIGVLASGDDKMIGRLKKKVSIWNMNSLAEFFMQILDKYKKDYQNSLIQLKKERSRFYQELCKIKNIKVYQSQANYFMCELLGEKTSEKLAGELLKNNILIKDLTEKIGNGKQYIRIAIRTKEENDILLQALKSSFLFEK